MPHQVAQHVVKLAGEAGVEAEALHILDVGGKVGHAGADDNKQEDGKESVGACSRQRRDDKGE